MRIIAGSLGGRRIAAPRGADTRPTSDRVREALFSMLEHEGVLRDAWVLDLFAGTGALGLEALSRGAAHATLVDDGARAHALLRQNITKARVQDKASLLRRDATRLGRHAGPTFDVVFLDPPYGQGRGEVALASAMQGDWIGAGAWIIWEESRAPTLPPGVILLDRRSYGDTVVTLARVAANEAA